MTRAVALVEFLQGFVDVCDTFIAHSLTTLLLGGQWRSLLAQTSHPRMGEDFADGDSGRRIWFEHPTDQIFRSVGCTTRFRVVSVLDFHKELSNVGVVKGHGSSEHDVQDHTKTPHIAFWTLVRLALDDFRRRIERTTNTAGCQWGRRNVLGEPKISNL